MLSNTSLDVISDTMIDNIEKVKYRSSSSGTRFKKLENDIV